MSYKMFITLIATLATLCSVAAKGDSFIVKRGAYRIISTTSAPGSVAKVGDNVKLTLKVVGKKKEGYFTIQKYRNGNPLGKTESYPLGETAKLEFTAKAPGNAAIVCHVFDKDGKPALWYRKRKIASGIGVIISPEKIMPGNINEPDDFDKFWKSQREQLDKIPVTANVKEVPTPEFPDVICRDVQVACTGKIPVSGYLHMPRNAKPKTLPIVVEFHGAGVRSANLRPKYGRKAIYFNVNAHGLPNGKSKKYYSALNKGALKNYRTDNLNSRDNNYFVGMFCRVMRALDYVKTLPEWDGKNLMVFGISQGGGQSLVAAALDPQVTLCCAEVPALCDLGGRLAKRRPGWPIVHLPKKQHNNEDVISATAYIDCVSFAKRIKATVYVSTGLIDHVCISTGICAMFNQLPEKNKHTIFFNPTGYHAPCRQSPGFTLMEKTLGI